MTGYTINKGERLRGNVNESHVMLNLPPCSMPMPNGDGTNAPTWSSPHHHTVFSSGEREARNRRVSAQNRRVRNNAKKASEVKPVGEI